ncbi:uncharacterized protein [Apostichopus japonicus]
MKTPSFYRILALLFTLVGIVHCQPQCPTICTCSPDPVLNTGVIDCSNRGLTSIPDNLVYPFGGTIGKIDLSNNMLTTLDIDRLFTLLRGSQVEALDFSSNLISDVTGTFDALDGKDYVTLNLSSNAFTSFPENVIPVNHLRNELVLDFSNNRLTELTRHIFAGGNDPTLFGFQFLARNNLINRIDDETFQGVEIVDTILDLRSNLLTTLSPTFQSPVGVRELRFSGNPWNCDCNLRWIINPMRFLVNHTSTDPPNCVTPVAIQGRPIFSLTSNEFTCLPFQQGPLQRNIVNPDSFTLSCPASADPPTPEISWTVWLPCPNGGDPLELFFTSDEITLSDIDTNPRAAFRCTAINNAGSVDFDLDIRVDGEKGIDIPGTSNVVPPDNPGEPRVESTMATTKSVSGVVTVGGDGDGSSTVGGNDDKRSESPNRPVASIIILVIILIISWSIIGFLIYRIWRLKKEASAVGKRPPTESDSNGNTAKAVPKNGIYNDVTHNQGWKGSTIHPELSSAPTYAAPEKTRHVKPSVPLKPPSLNKPAPPPKPKSNPYQYNTEYVDPPLRFGAHNGGYSYHNDDSAA